MKILLLLSILVFPFCSYAQNVGIGTNSPSTNALLDMTSNSKGVLIPRMKKAERMAITSPEEGLMVYQYSPDSIGFYYYHNTWRWLNDEASLPSTAIVLSSTQTNTNLLNSNFNYKGQLFLSGAMFSSSGFTSTPNTWYSTNSTVAPLPANGTVNLLGAYNAGSFYVCGGYSGSNAGIGLYKYDPVANTWTLQQAQGSFLIAAKANGAVANGKWVIWGGLAAAADVNSPAYVYDFAGNTFINAPTNSDIARSGPTAVAIGNDVYFWGGFKYNDPSTLYNAGYKYSTTGNTWTTISSSGAPAARFYANAVSTGAKMLIWGGVGSGGTLLTTGGMYDIAAGTWTAMSIIGAPTTGSAFPIMVASGSNMIVISGNETKQFNSLTNTWTSLAATPVSFNGNKFAHDGGNKIYIWGGSPYYFFGSPVNTGYVYDIVANQYTPLTTVNAPSARSGHTMVYGNNELFVWSGSASTGGTPTAAESVITGGRYILNSQTIASTDSLESIYLYEKK